MKANGWTLLYHPQFSEAMQKLARAAQNANKRGDYSNANIKLFDQIMKQIREVIPADPAARKFQQGNTLGRGNRYWRRAKFGGRFRLFFRYDSSKKVIAYVWVNDGNTQRKAGSRTDPYEVFKKMVASGDPPADFQELVDICQRELNT